MRRAAVAEPWGARLDGREGTVRAKDESMQRTVAFMMALLGLGVSTAGLWDAAIGLWTHSLLYRRVAFGLLENVYTFSPAPGVVERPSAAARDELLMLLAFAPLLVADIRSPVSTTVTACDASPWACAGVEAELSEQTVSELWRFRDRRGGYVRCETPFEAVARDIMSSADEAAQRALESAYADDGEEVPTLTDHERQFSWVSEIADALGWRPAYRYRARLSEHINLKEARAYRTLVRRKAADAKAHGSRHLVLNDSFVVRGSAAKGRSSSWGLNGVLSPVVPDQLVANQTFGSLAVPTKHNPADDPTRDRPVRRRPEIPYPDWLLKLDNGQYAEWDERYGALPCATPDVLFPVGAISECE